MQRISARGKPHALSSGHCSSYLSLLVESTSLGKECLASCSGASAWAETLDAQCLTCCLERCSPSGDLLESLLPVGGLLLADNLPPLVLNEVGLCEPT